MNSDLAYQFRRISIDSVASNSSSVPPPPEMLSACNSSFDSQGHGFELDCSRFDIMAPSPSIASSYNSQMSQASYSSSLSSQSNTGFSRSRCVHNLSSLGGSSSADHSGVRSTMQTSSSPNDGWGYFVDAR